MQNSKLKETLLRNIRLINTLNFVMFIGLGVTTFYTGFTVSADKINDMFPQLSPFFVALFAVFVAFSIAYVFDNKLRENFLLGLQAIYDKEYRSAAKSVRGAAMFIMLVVVFRLLLSGGATFISSQFIADDLIEDVDVSQVEKNIEEKQKTKQTLSANLEKEIEQIRSDAEKRARQIVSNAIGSAPKSWQKMYRDRNNWFMTNPKFSKYIRSIEQAKTQAAATREDAAKRIAQRRNAVTSLIEQENKDTVFAALASVKLVEVKKSQSLEWSATLGLWVLDGLFLIMAVLTSFPIVLVAREEDMEIVVDEIGWADIAREHIKVISRTRKAKLAKMVVEKDKQAMDVITSIGGSGATISLAAKGLRLNRNIAQSSATGGAKEEGKPASTSIANDVSKDYLILSQRLEKAKSNLRAYRSNISRGKGNKETNEKGLSRWLSEVQKIESQLLELR
jgi:hypothetical protein